jgi:ketosteroid isomerase-like protein
MREKMRPNGARAFRTGLGFLLCVAVLLAAAGQATAQQKKNKKDTTQPNSGPVIPMTDEKQIDYMISTMLGAWQVGDAGKMHECYADDVTIVSSTFDPPAIGWNTYLPLYQQQRARMQQVRMDRSNTFIKVNGISGWATYQWDFSGTVDGQLSASQGHTTVVVEKRNAKWVIVLNHTSVAEGRPANMSAPSSAQPH